MQYFFQHLAQFISIENGDCGPIIRIGSQPVSITPKEVAGLLPSRIIIRKNGGWTVGHLLNMIIGQGAILVTPLQMARFIRNRKWRISLCLTKWRSPA